MKKLYQKLKNRLMKLTISSVILIFIILSIAVYFIQNIAITILSGQSGVLWSRFQGGTKVNYIYSEGMHFIFPWDKMYIYNVRIQEMSSELDVLTRSGLQVNVYLSVRYAPDQRMLGMLHQKVGPEYPEKIIMPEIESVIRETIGTMDAEQIYTTGREVLAEALDEAVEQISRRYIRVDDVLIRKIELPSMVAEAIKTKIKEKHLVKAHEYMAEKKRVDARGISNYNEIVTKSLSDEKILKWHGIMTTKAFAESGNTKTFVMGLGKDGVPIILNPELSEK